MQDYLQLALYDFCNLLYIIKFYRYDNDIPIMLKILSLRDTCSGIDKRNCMAVEFALK